METSVAGTPATAGVKTRQRCNWTAEEKAAWVAEWEKSGETMSEFSRQNDLPSATFNLWVRQFRGPTIGTSEAGALVELPIAAPADLAVSAGTATTEPVVIARIRLPSGAIVEFTAGMELAVLAQLIRSLQ
jgi:transposase-like protein